MQPQSLEEESFEDRGQEVLRWRMMMPGNKKLGSIMYHIFWQISAALKLEKMLLYDASAKKFGKCRHERMQVA